MEGGNDDVAIGVATNKMGEKEKGSESLAPWIGFTSNSNLR